MQESAFETLAEYQTIQVGNYKFQVLNSILKESGIVASINNKNILFVFSKLNGAGNNEYMLNFSNFEIICSKYNNYTTIQCETNVVFKTTGETAENIVDTNQTETITIR